MLRRSFWRNQMLESFKEKMLEEVSLISLKKIVNERGHLLEVQRSDDDHYLGFGQAYITSTIPGVVKAWYRHSTQHDQITLLKGALHLVLYDTRENSKTCHLLQHIYLEEDNPLLVQIPPGIWHGFKAIATEPTLLLHLNTVPFVFANPDEDRLAADDLSIPYHWGNNC
jgi:dTDP-4-dehydrorhamnose 3,5-epimerase